MSARSTKKGLLAAILAASMLGATGCVGQVFSEGEQAPEAPAATLQDVMNDVACWLPHSPQWDPEAHFYDDVYTQKDEQGECLTEAEALQREELAAAEEAAYLAELPGYRSALEAEISNASEPADVLWQVVSFYCTTSYEEVGSYSALWDASEEAYYVHWTVEAELLWPFDFWMAIDAFCPAPTLHNGEYFDEDAWLWPEEFYDPLPPVVEDSTVA